MFCKKKQRKLIHQNEGQNHNIKIANGSFENVMFRCFGMTLTNESCNKKIRKLSLGNVWCHSVLKFMSSCLLSKNVKIKTFKKLILPAILSGCEYWFITQREEHRHRVFENRQMRRILGPNREEVTGDRRKLQNEELHNLYSSPNILGIIKSRGMRWVAYARDEKCIQSLVRNSEGKRPLGTPGHKLEDNIKMASKK
jgi:hypothetical protein